MAVDTPVHPITSLLPLVFVISVTAVKQGYEDFLRHKKDTRENTRPVTLIRNGVSQDSESRHVRVGDVVLVRSGQEVPCDMVLVASSDNAGRCTVTTANLDGETNLKALAVPAPVRNVRYPEQLLALRGVIECEQSHSDLYRFYGRIELTEALPQSKTDLRWGIMRPSETSNISLVAGACVNERDRIITTIPSVVAFACSPTPSATERAIAVVGAFDDSPATTPTIQEERSPPTPTPTPVSPPPATPLPPPPPDRAEQTPHSLRPLLLRCLPGVLRGDASTPSSKKPAPPTPSKLPVPGEGASSSNGSAKPRISFSTWAASQDPNAQAHRRASSPPPTPTDLGAPQKIILTDERPHSVPDQVFVRRGEAVRLEDRPLAIVGPAPASRPTSLLTDEPARSSASRSAVARTSTLIAPMDDNEDDSMSAALTIDNLLLKGSRLHTDYVYGTLQVLHAYIDLASRPYHTRD